MARQPDRPRWAPAEPGRPLETKDTNFMILYGNWRSLATYRVRVALALKAIPHDVIAIDLASGEHHGERFKAINPQGVLPALDDGHGAVLFQSLAIIEYLDETHPTPPLLPADPAGRARVRGLAQIHAADVHPLLVPRVRNHLQKDAGLDDAALQRWLARALLTGLDAIEANLAHSPHTGEFCHGNTPTLADICLASHLIAMQLFKVDASSYPTTQRIYAACERLPAFAGAHPLKQPGAPAS
jgi:maleylacetoacetate isomerase